MKRSEAIKFIQNYLNLIRDGNEFPDAHAILHITETLIGMAPPIDEKRSFKIADSDTGEMTYEVHEWDEE